MRESSSIAWILNKILPFDADIIECTSTTAYISVYNKIYNISFGDDTPIEQAKDIKKQLQEKYPELIL